MWLENPAEGDLIEIDPSSVRSGATQILTQVLRGTDAMGIHFNGIGTTAPSACLCDLWDSSIPGLTDELGALGDAVIKSFNDYLQSTNELLQRANQLQAEQAQAANVATVGGVGVNPGFGAALAQAIVNDGNNRSIATWLGTTPGTSQVDILLALQGQGGGNPGAALSGILGDANDYANKVWLAPDGTSYAGEDASGRDLYRDGRGDVGTISDIHRDSRDENYNNDDDDYEVS